MKKLYGARSSIAHGHLIQPGKNLDLSSLRNYLCESIKQIILINKSQEELHKDLDVFGFGERPWIE